MIHLFSSHHLQNHAMRLARLLADTAPGDPLAPQTVIIPNLDTARWLKLFIAGENRFAGNIEWLLPAEWQWKQVRKLYPDLPKLLPSDPQPMKWSLFEVLTDSEIRSKFPVLDTYILARPEDAREQAVHQLAGQLASVFDQYLVYRPEMLLNWQKGNSGAGDEAWQAELWRTLNKRWKSTGESAGNKAELFLKTLQAVQKGAVEPEDTLFIFNPGIIPMPVLKLLKAAGACSDIHFFVVQPAQKPEENEHLLFKSFGEESLQLQKLLSLLEGESEFYFKPSGKTSTLGNIQQGIITGSPIKENTEAGSLSGIEIRSCHSPVREIETLHQFLLERFEADETLHPDDVLVVTPDPDRYAPAIRAVFDNPEQDHPGIPYHLGISQNTGSGLVRAMEQFLELIDSRFQFPKVMDLFLSEPVREAYSLSESAASRVKEWMQQNHVVWGIDAAHRNEWGLPGDDNQTWYSALKSGWLGQWTGTEEGELYEDSLLFGGINTTTDQEIWAVFASFLNRLSALRTESKQKRTLADWNTWLSRSLSGLIHENTLESNEGLRLTSLQQKLSESGKTGGGNPLLSYSLFKEEIKDALAQPHSAGAMFTLGVVFSSMVPVRSIPFRVIALIGLNENEFPRKPTSPSYDLVAKYPRPGDRNRKHEDRNLFLESILAAGDVHYCSYIGQSPVDNEELPPSSIVSEWVGYLSSITGLNEAGIVRKEALNSFSPTNFSRLKSYSGLNHAVVQTLFGNKEPVSGLQQSRPLPQAEEPETISISEMARFYKNPAGWFLRKRFEVYYQEADQEKDEFAMDNLEYHLLFQRVLGWVLEGMEDEHIRALLLKSGAVPAGWPGIRKVDELLGYISAAIEKCNEIGVEPVHRIHEAIIQLPGNVIEGSIVSYSREGFLGINPSSFSGKNAIYSWVHYVCWVLSSGGQGNAYWLCNLKGGQPKLFSFKKPDHPEKIVRALVEFYISGLMQPHHFFPGTVYEYENTIEAKGEAAAQRKAKDVFEGGYMAYGEREDMSVVTLLGNNARFSGQFLDETYRGLIKVMMDHMEELK